MNARRRIRKHRNRFLMLLILIVLSVAGRLSPGEGAGSSDGSASAQYDSANISAETESNGSEGETEPVGTHVGEIDLADIPDWSGEPYVEINGNIPDFPEEDLTEESFEYYSELDALGRCGVAYANLGQDLMPTEERGDISSIHPTGWQSVQYEGIDGEALYNRCHLIAYSLTAENANERNLITGTRYLNKEGMLPFEEMVAAYIDRTGNHVLYRVTPVFEGDNLVASGVQMEAMSVEDEGAGIQFNVYCYNVQPGIGIDYATGDNWLEDADALAASSAGTASDENMISNENAASDESVTSNENAASDGNASITYILNKNTMKFHLSSCESADEISAKNRLEYTGDREAVIAMGYEPCKRCNP
ncbi:MAG: DNA/RNA non-specific endonuclease [Lachnospiraceae bacterium]|nr:DNA/RNA non-specific endonuclease [Lachnospiraceae bacterium]